MTKKDKLDNMMSKMHDGCIIREGHHFYRSIEYKCLRCGLCLDDCVYHNENETIGFRPCRPGSSMEGF